MFDPCEPLTVGTDSSSLLDKRSIEEAIGLWNRLAGTRLSFSDTSSAALEIGFEPALPAQFGLYDDEKGVIFINRNLEAGRARTITIAHELGHAMGLEHVKNSGQRSVMVPGNTETPPGEVDRKALTALWGTCPPRE